VALLSFVLFVKGLGDLSAAAVFYRGIRPAYKRWQVRRYLGRVSDHGGGLHDLCASPSDGSAARSKAPRRLAT
jgi:hypothetical protein